MAKRRKTISKGWAIDKSGRWRDGFGRFASHERIQDMLALSSPEQVADMLQRSARNQGRSKKQRVIVHAHFDGVGWRSLGTSDMGMKVVLDHSADWLRNEMGLRLGEYRKLDKVNRKKLRRGEHIEPRITDVRVVKLAPSKMERKAAAKKRKRKRK